jgi:hypothetical protein
VNACTHTRSRLHAAEAELVTLRLEDARGAAVVDGLTAALAAERAARARAEGERDALAQQVCSNAGCSLYNKYTPKYMSMMVHAL